MMKWKEQLKAERCGIDSGASFLSAVNGAIFKLIAVQKGFWVSLLGFHWSSDGRFDLIVLGSKFTAEIFWSSSKQRELAAVGLIALSTAAAPK